MRSKGTMIYFQVLLVAIISSPALLLFLFIPLDGFAFNQLFLSSIFLGTFIVALPMLLARILLLVINLLLTVALVNASRLKSPIYPEQVYGFIDAPGVALSMASASISTTLFLAIVFVFVMTKISFAMIKHKETRNPRLNILAMTSILSTIIYFDLGVHSTVHPALKVTNATKSYFFPYNDKVMQREWVTPDRATGVLADNNVNIFFLVGEAISNEVASEDNVFESLKAATIGSETEHHVDFTKAFSTGPFTSLSVLNFYFMDTSDKAKQPIPSIFMKAKAAGYSTAYFNSRNARWGNIQRILSEGVDSFVDMTTTDFCRTSRCSLLGGVDDELILDKVSQTLSTIPGPYFATWHTDLVHPPYKRYSESDNDSIFQAYSNGLKRFSQLAERVLRLLPTNSLLVITADHGALHTGDTLNVPLHIIYKGESPEAVSLIDSISVNQEQPITHLDVLTTIFMELKYSPSNTRGRDLSERLGQQQIKIETQTGMISPTIQKYDELVSEINKLL